MSELLPEEFRAGLEEGLANDEAQALREQLAAAIPSRLAENGFRLSVHHQLTGDRGGMGFATITEMAAELADGAAVLYAGERWYPGAALVRQLIECGYLLALAGERREETETWFGSSRDEVLRMFMPRHMRQRSARDFRVGEYQSHSDFGGHPNPAGRGLLRRHEEWRSLPPRWLWLDLAQHAAETWEFFRAALPLYDPRLDPADPLHSPESSPNGGHEVEGLLALWREHDPLADRLPNPDTQ
jgi:hypothetical protein